jgi:hypothetical protein
MDERVAAAAPVLGPAAFTALCPAIPLPCSRPGFLNKKTTATIFHLFYLFFLLLFYLFIP